MLNHQATTAVTVITRPDPHDLTFGQAKPMASMFSSDYFGEDTANEARASNGYLALSAYVQKAYGNPEHEPVEQGVRDLLGDLQHLCHKWDLDFNGLFLQARSTFLDELLHPIG